MICQYLSPSIGEEDIVRCHYCDGGLRNWESGDDPWEEHTRWFPFCKFVIKMKGREYIEEIRKQTEVCLPLSYHCLILILYINCFSHLKKKQSTHLYHIHFNYIIPIKM